MRLRPRNFLGQSHGMATNELGDRWGTRQHDAGLDERAFESTDEQWLEQAKQNHEETAFFMHQLGDAFSHQTTENEVESDSEGT